MMDDNEGRGQRLPAEITQESVESCLPSEHPKTLAATWAPYEAADKQRRPAGLHEGWGWGGGDGGGGAGGSESAVDREACLSRESRPLEALRCPTSHLSPTGSAAVTGSDSCPFVSLTHPGFFLGGCFLQGRPCRYQSQYDICRSTPTTVIKDRDGGSSKEGASMGVRARGPACHRGGVILNGVDVPDRNYTGGFYKLVGSAEGGSIWALDDVRGWRWDHVIRICT